MREVIWRPFDISKYVSYEQDGYAYAGCYENDYWPLDKAEYAYRAWEKTNDGCKYKIVETDLLPAVDCDVIYPSDGGIFIRRSNYYLHIGRITWQKRIDDGKWSFHRDDGPALIRINKLGKLSRAEWWINDDDISCEVRPWLKSMGMPAFYNWTDEHKALFKLAFA